MKNLLLIILICIAAFNARAQKISGEYIQTSFSEGARKITFSKGKFVYFKPGDLNKSYGIGDFSIKKGLLRLNYKKVPNQDSSFYTLKTIKSKPSDSVFYRIRLVDADGVPSFGIIDFRDKEYSSLKKVYPDKSGNANFSIPRNMKFKYLTIINMGDYRVILPYSRLKGRNVEVFVKFKPAEMYYMEPKLVVYKIEKLEGDELVLSSEEEGQIKFKKVN